MTDRPRLAAWLAVDLVLMGLLHWTGPNPAAIRAAAADPQGWVDRVGPDAVAATIAGLLCWATLLWVTIILLLVASAAAPGAIGLCAEAFAGYLVPAALRRGATVALGVSLGTAALTSTAVAEPTPRASSHAGRSAAAVGYAQDHGPHGSASAAAGVDWPLDPARTAATPRRGGPSTSPTGGQTGTSGSTDPHRAPPPTSVVPTTAAGQATATRPAPAVGSRPIEPGPATRVARTGKDSGPAPPGTRSGTRPASAPTPVAVPADSGALPRSALVRPGDCLWLIAAQRLGPQATAAEVASEWPRWYAANRQLIGADPDLIRPGQVLVAPSDPAGTATFSIWRPQ